MMDMNNENALKPCDGCDWHVESLDNGLCIDCHEKKENVDNE